MKVQTYINIIFIICFTTVCISIYKNKNKENNDIINYELYQYRFHDLQSKYDSLALQVRTSLNQIDSVKLKLLSDEIKIDNLTHAGIDSAFAVLLSKR